MISSGTLAYPMSMNWQKAMSSEQQVRSNTESQRLQYALVDRARDLGFERVEVVDVDLGANASIGAKEREGFQALIASVALGEVGMVLSREVSRLSRTDKDWCQLQEVYQVFGVLLADAERVYDLRLMDDQLILGIKETMSVVELPVNKPHEEGMRIVWQLPSQAFVSGVLHNPFCAGAYVWGQRPSEVRMVDGKLMRVSGEYREPEDCEVLIRDHHEGYIGWSEYEENRRRQRGGPSVLRGAVAGDLAAGYGGQRSLFGASQREEHTQVS